MCLQTLLKIYSFTTINMNYINKKRESISTLPFSFIVSLLLI